MTSSHSVASGVFDDGPDALPDQEDEDDLSLLELPMWRLVCGTSGDDRLSLYLWKGIGLVLFQTLSGATAVMLYSTAILDDIKDKDTEVSAVEGAVIINVVHFVVTVLGWFLSDVWSRRRLLVVGFAVMTVSLVSTTAVLFSMPTGPSRDAAVISLLSAFLGGYAIGPGIASHTVLSEMLPTRIRMRGMAIYMVITFALLLLIAFPTLSIANFITNGDKTQSAGHGYGVLFAFFAFFAFVGTIFCYFLPETKGSTLERLAMDMRRGSSAARVAGIPSASSRMMAAERTLLGYTEQDSPVLGESSRLGLSDTANSRRAVWDPGHDGDV